MTSQPLRSRADRARLCGPCPDDSGGRGLGRCDPADRKCDWQKPFLRPRYEAEARRIHADYPHRGSCRARENDAGSERSATHRPRSRRSDDALHVLAADSPDRDCRAPHSARRKRDRVRLRSRFPAPAVRPRCTESRRAPRVRRVRYAAKCVGRPARTTPPAGSQTEVFSRQAHAWVALVFQRHG